jgi:hypothetical protein
MFNLKDLADAKNKVKGIRKQTAGNAYEEGVQILEEFEDGEPDKEKLTLAADKLIEALKYDSENVEAYICLSYIYYILGEDQVCLKYLQIAEEIFEEELPEELEHFKQSLIQSIDNQIEVDLNSNKPEKVNNELSEDEYDEDEDDDEIYDEDEEEQ